MTHRTGALAVATLLAMLACRAAEGDHASTSATGGTIVIAVPADVEPLIPPYALANQTKLVVEQVFDRLADIGDSLNYIGDHGFTPQLADRWTWAKDSLSIAFHVNPAARWHDGVPVRASDVRFTYTMYRDSAVGSDVRTQIASIDSVTVPDSMTAVFWFSRRDPEQFFNATYQMYISPEHLLGHIAPADLKSSDFGRHPIGTGRFRFRSWTPNASVDLVADTANYRGRAHVDHVILTVAPNYAAATARLFAGDADFYQVMHADNLPEIARHPELHAVPYTETSYCFLWFNLREPTPPPRPPGTRPHPVFADRAVRRAIGMALDRDRMLRNAFDSLALVPKGPFYHSASFADTTIVQLPYDTIAARRTLDSAGWVPGRDGVRAKHGHRLAFTIIVPTSSSGRVRYAQLIQDQLHRVGAAVTVQALEFGAFRDRLRAHDFDAAINVWVMDPSPNDTRQTWTTLAESEGFNWGSYSNPAFDVAVDSALTAIDPARAHAYFHRAFQIITDDAPGIWLYEPKQMAGVHRRIHLAYLRPDAWWAHLADWSIPPAERLPRDRIGLASAGS